METGDHFPIESGRTNVVARREKFHLTKMAALGSSITLAQTGSNWMALMLRFTVGTVFIVHGYHKLFTPAELYDHHVGSLVAVGTIPEPSRAKAAARRCGYE